MEKFLYAGVYRSHSGDRETTRLMEYLAETADIALQRYPTGELVFLGDFNAHHKEWLFPYEKTDHAGREARKLALALNLTQLVDQATRIPDIAGHTPNCLDLLLTTDPHRHSVSVSAPLGSSDHCVVKSVSVCSPPDYTHRGTRRVWRYESADWDEMRAFFASYPWRRLCFSSGNPSCVADAITAVIRQGMEYFIPFSDIPLGYKARPWFNADCARAEARKQSAYQAWVKARDRKVRARKVRAKKRAYNAASRSCKRVLRKARFDHISRIGAKLASYPPGSKQFWSLSKSVESNFCRPTLPPLQKPDGSLAHTATEKANLFADLFASNSRLDTGSKHPPTLPHCDSLMPEITVFNKEVRRSLLSLDVNKASGPDGIPARVLRYCAPELSPVLTRLYRLSLKTKIVPKSWKLANVQPVPKKGSRADPSNYRPIAITSVLCKVMERVLNRKLLSYLEDNDLLSDRQYGFRRGRSTGDLLVYVTHCWGEAIENHGEAIAVSLDISKAFDRVWHASLLSKLPAYGIPAGFCNWVADFLSERSIRVVIDGCSSELMAIDAGVPQGSVLSATLFLLHINDLLSSGIVGYADDSTVMEKYLSSAGASGVEVQRMREAMVERTSLTLSNVSQWGDHNLVSFNASKTQACLFSAKRSPFTLSPTFRGTSVPVTDTLQLLGIELSSDLNFGTAIESKAQIAARKLGVLNKVKRYFTPEQLLNLYKAQVRSCMEYCCHLWDGSAKYQLAALDSVERRAKRIIGDNKLVASKLHSLAHRRKVACLSVFYRLYFGECAQELHELIPPSPFFHRTNRRTAGYHPFLVDTPSIRTKRFSSSFIMRTAKEWNSLPASVFPSAYNLTVFKSRVNRHLLGKLVPS
ncbi:hypothetical protein ABMA28_005179 [Loxostege sticticalis]|uniref:Reverse transcriptase domain-containing protein n=1 Tax=Loxostege sticticalis TaxID=481309 RepID=A0ABD0SPM7_LOXSC